MEDIIFIILLGFALLVTILLYKFSGKNSKKNPNEGTYDNHDAPFGDDGGIDFFD